MKQITSLLLILLFFNISGCFVSPGSYADGEWYKVWNNPDSVIARMKLIKKQHPNYDAWQTDQNHNRYNPDGRHGNFYSFYFLLPFQDTTVLIHSVISGVKNSDEEKCNIIINGYTYAKDFRGWRWNESKYKEEQKEVLNTFEKEVLDKLDMKYKKLWFR